ncbi:unnamed protein product [Brassica oleracea]
MVVFPQIYSRGHLYYNHKQMVLQHPCIVKEIIQNSHLGYKLLCFSVNMHLSHHLLIYHIFSDAAWYCSAWDRTYAFFLEERHKCYHVLKYDIEAERLVRA